MAPKRAADSEPAKRGPKPKKSRTPNLVPVVVDVLTNAEALPKDLRTVFEVALPHVLGANKADRHAYEMEMVEQAEKSLTEVQASLESSHGEALTKQNEVIAPEEHARRTSAKQAAEEGSEAARAKLEAKKQFTGSVTINAAAGVTTAVAAGATTAAAAGGVAAAPAATAAAAGECCSSGTADAADGSVGTCAEFVSATV